MYVFTCIQELYFIIIASGHKQTQWTQVGKNIQKGIIYIIWVFNISKQFAISPEQKYKKGVCRESNPDLHQFLKSKGILQFPAGNPKEASYHWTTDPFLTIFISGMIGSGWKWESLFF